MSRRGFLEQATRQRATEVIRQIESETAAEVVVAVRKHAGRYLRTSVMCGAGAALLVLLMMLFSPTIYHWVWIGIDTVLAFALTSLLFALITPLRMAFTSAKVRQRVVARTAAHVFRELGIQKTRDRTGLLVFVALQERRLCVLADEGIAEDVLSEDYQAAIADMEDAVSRLDEESFLAALQRLAQPLAQVLPRQPDDENELSDDVV